MDQTVREIMAKRKFGEKTEVEYFVEECRAKLRAAADIPTTYVLTVTVTGTSLDPNKIVTMTVKNHEEYNHTFSRKAYDNQQIARDAFTATCKMLISEGFFEDEIPLHQKKCTNMRRFICIV